VTHEEVRGLLPRYAAGVLEERIAEVVRGHLAEGCLDCLQYVFGPPLVPAASAPRPGRWWLAGAWVAIALACVTVAGSVMVERRASPRTAERERLLGELRTARRTLARRLATLESAAAHVASASRDAVEARAAMADVQRELNLSQLRIRALKQAMRRQDVDSREKQQSFAAVIARLSAGLPAGGAGSVPERAQTGCRRLADPARGLCIAFCEVQRCETTDDPGCEPIRARYQAVTGRRAPPCRLATATGRLAPCEESHVDVWSFAARAGQEYTVTAETVDAAAGADLCLAGSCGAETFAGNDELPCRGAPAFRCPRAQFVAVADGSCTVAVSICSPECTDPRTARYELAVEGAAALSLFADDVSSLTGEMNDVF
jgi:hypothetical protein